jgi:DUF4097 and DUF4098 domain-containing protein YvlB
MKPIEAKRTEEWSLPTQGTSGVRARTADSAIRVTAAAGDQIRVVALMKARAATEAEAVAFLDRIEVQRQRDGDRWLIEATWPEPRSYHVEGVSVSLELQAPPEFALEARSSNGSVEAEGVGEAFLRTSNGRIAARNIGRRVAAETSNGAVHVEGCSGPVELKTANGRVEARAVQGEVKIHTSNGAIHVEACAGPVQLKTENARIEVRDTPSAVTAHTSNGAIHVEGCAGPVEARTSCGSITLRRAHSPVKATTSEGRIEVELAPGETAVEAELVTRNASVDLRLPAGVSARLSARTSNGRIQIHPALNGSSRASATDLETVLGGGEGSIRIQTSNGSIQIHSAG